MNLCYQPLLHMYTLPYIFWEIFVFSWDSIRREIHVECLTHRVIYERIHIYRQKMLKSIYKRYLLVHILRKHFKANMRKWFTTSNGETIWFHYWCWNMMRWVKMNDRCKDKMLMLYSYNADIRHILTYSWCLPAQTENESFNDI